MGGATTVERGGRERGEAVERERVAKVARCGVASMPSSEGHCVTLLSLQFQENERKMKERSREEGREGGKAR